MKVKQAIRKIIILGGGTAGWMAAAALANNPVFAAIELCLVESDNIGTIGVGEGSTPHLKRFMDNLGISEKDWMERCHASYKTASTLSIGMVTASNTSTLSIFKWM